MELSVCELALLALLAIFLTLYHYRNKPSQDWPRWLSLNTMVSIYVLVLKSSILFIAGEGIGQLKWCWFAKVERPLYDAAKYDDATRGPLGAGVLLSSLRARYLVAPFGAFLTMLALWVDPTMQQIMYYRDCEVPVPRLASIPRTSSTLVWLLHGLLDEGVHLGKQILLTVNSIRGMKISRKALRSS